MADQIAIESEDLVDVGITTWEIAVEMYARQIPVVCLRFARRDSGGVVPPGLRLPLLLLDLLGTSACHKLNVRSLWPGT